jgi:DNA (cytosine-5)-methyltransferase 1
LVSAPGFGWGEGWTEHELRSRGLSTAVASIGGSQVLECPDGKWRPLPPPGVRWVGNEIPARVSKLRLLGNAIDPYAAATFIEAAAESFS